MSYDDINGQVLEDIKRHEAKQAANQLRVLSSLAECEEKSTPPSSPMVVTPTPQPKKALRGGRRRVSILTENGHVNDPLDAIRDSLGSHASSISVPCMATLESVSGNVGSGGATETNGNNSFNSSGHVGYSALELHEKFAREDFVALELEAFSRRVDKYKMDEQHRKEKGESVSLSSARRRGLLAMLCCWSAEE